MELTQLRYFQTVARLQNITRAALELNVSQPTLSQSLRRLESSLGYPLFVHTPGKRLQLNEAGRIFLEKVDRALAELDQGVSLVRESSLISRAQVFLGTAIQELCTEIVLSFYKKAPDVRVSQQLVEINDLPEMLISEEIDFALSPCPLDEYDARLDSVPLYTEEFFAIVGPDHPFHGRKTVNVQELAGQRFICNFSEADLEFLCKLVPPDAVTGELDVMLQSNEPLVVKLMVACGSGVAFMPGRVVMRRLETGDPLMQNPIRITGYDQITPTCICRKKSRTLEGAAAELYQYVIDYLNKENQLMDYFLQTYFSE